MTANHDTSAGPSKGADSSLIKEFIIEGLYGYRTIGLASPYAATILIAKNGTGKTTLLGALDAFLRMQLGRLRGLDFKRIICRIDGIASDLTLTHDDVIGFLQTPTDNEFLRIASRSSVEPKQLFNYLVEEYISSSRHDRSYVDNKVYNSLITAFGYNHGELERNLTAVTEAIFQRNENISSIRSSIKSRLHGIQIVYLPTYRRVELALTEDEDVRRYGRRRGPKFSVAAGSLFTGDIQFGLGDIADRLRDINNEIVYSSNNGYREISANIINDLIDGKFETGNLVADDVPSKADLDLFFSRLKEGRRTQQFPQVKPPNLDRLYEPDQVPQSSRPFLGYFLNQLGVVIRTTKEIEQPVELFTNSCNKYLMSDEPSTRVVDDKNVSAVSSLDGKELVVNRRNLRVYVRSLPKRRKISLDALSSGEKQMISLFAKLFLYPEQKLVLIDEPELSLSIDWQSQILVDVLNAPLCKQVIAITHSPFVFDNELDPFARPISIQDAETEEDYEELELDLSGGDDD